MSLCGKCSKEIDTKHFDIHLRLKKILAEQGLFLCPDCEPEFFRELDELLDKHEIDDLSVLENMVKDIFLRKEE